MFLQIDNLMSAPILPGRDLFTDENTVHTTKTHCFQFKEKIAHHGPG